MQIEAALQMVGFDDIEILNSREFNRVKSDYQNIRVPVKSELMELIENVLSWGTKLNIHDPLGFISLGNGQQVDDIDKEVIQQGIVILETKLKSATSSFSSEGLVDSLVARLTTNGKGDIRSLERFSENYGNLLAAKNDNAKKNHIRKLKIQQHLKELKEALKVDTKLDYADLIAELVQSQLMHRAFEKQSKNSKDIVEPYFKRLQGAMISNLERLNLGEVNLPKITLSQLQSGHDTDYAYAERLGKALHRQFLLDQVKVYLNELRIIFVKCAEVISGYLKPYTRCSGYLFCEIDPRVSHEFGLWEIKAYGDLRLLKHNLTVGEISWD